MKKNAGLVLYLILSQVFLLGFPAHAEIISDAKITAIHYLEDGRAEIAVKGASGGSSFIVSEQTLIEGALPAKKVKSGHWIFRPASASGSGGGKRGFRSPFAGLSKSMRKSMGLPEIASVPEVPGGRPAEIPQIPKIPKGPTGKTSPFVIDPNAVPTEEEENLFGRMEEDKGAISQDGKAAKIVSSSPEPVQPVTAQTQKVLSVKKTDDGVLLELESANGQKEEMTLAGDKEVLRLLSIGDLRKNMKIRLEAAEGSEGLLAQKITIRD